MIDGKKLREAAARSSAGHLALATVQQHGPDIGGAMISGYLQAFVLAHAAVHGWPKTYALIAEICNEANGPIPKAKPRLKIVNS